MIHPSANIQKEYLAKTDCEITPDHLKAISNGTLVEGVFVKPLRVEKVRRGTLKVTISEGKKREVRQMLETAGLTTPAADADTPWRAGAGKNSRRQLIGL